MNILYVGAFRLPNLDAAAPRVLNNGRAFVSLGHKVSFLSWGGEYRESDLCENGLYRIDGMKYEITGELYPKTSFFARLKQSLTRGDKSLELIKKLEHKPDLIIMYQANNHFAKKVITYCIHNNIKLANDITEWYDNNELHFYDWIPNYINMTRTQRKVNNKILISSFLNRLYPESNNLVIPPLCSINELRWGATIEDERIKPFDGITLIYAGTPAKKDSLHSVINAVNKLAIEGRAIRFIILGSTRENYISNYSDLLNSQVLHDNIIFLGRVSQDLIPAYYKKSDFMVLLRKPTRKNMAGFPTKFAESMMTGVPVITNDTSDLKDYVVSGKTGFLVHGYDSDSLYKILSENVIGLNKKTITEMKIQVAMMNKKFDYKNRINDFEKFIANLK